MNSGIKISQMSLRGAQRRSNLQESRGLLRPQSARARNDIKRAWTIALLAIILFAFALRMFRASETRMWGDEGFSVYSAQRSLYAITFEGKDVDPHPPLYYYLFHFYLPFAGYSELAIRFFSVFFGTAAVALIYVIGKRLFDARVGACAAVVAALAPFAVRYAQEVRMYALVMFLGALALYFFVRLLERETRARWAGFAMAMLLTQYSFYQAAFLFVAQGIFLLPFLKSRRAFVLHWLALSLGVAILFVPWLLAHSSSAFADVKGVAGETVPFSLPEFIARGFAAISIGTTVPITNALALAALFVAVIVLGLGIALAAGAAKREDWLLIALVLIPLVALYPIYYLAPLYRGRLFALAFAPVALLLARSIDLIDQRARLASIPIALALLAISAYSLNDYFFRYDRYSAAVEDYLPAIRAVEQRAQPGDFVLFHAYWHEGYFLSHYRGAPIEYRALDNQKDLEEAVAQPRNVWAIVQALPTHDGEVWLSRNAFPLNEQNFGQMRLLSYRAGVPERAENFVTPIIFDNGMTLLGYRMNGAPLESGRGSATVELDWQATQKIAEDFTVSVRLTDPRGETIWAQEDTQPGNGTLPTSSWETNYKVEDRHGLTIPTGTPPGDYAIQVVLYESGTGRAANIIAPENLRAQSVALGAISIVKPRRGDSRIAPAIPNAFDAQWNEIMLAGFARGADQTSPGDEMPLTLYWRAPYKPVSDYLAAIQIIDSSGAARGSMIYRPANNAFPTRAWDAGETWLDKIRLSVDAEAAAGDASVFVGIMDETSGEAIAPRAAAPTRDLQVENPVTHKPISIRAVGLTRVQISGRTHRFDLPSPKFPLLANLDNKIKLLGYALDANTYRPGTAISLTLYWQALDKMGERFTVFSHVLDASGAIVAQRDSEPDAGRAPTTSWLRDEVIADAHQIELPKNLAPGDYTLAVGMYRAPSGKRLAVLGAKADRVILTKINISTP